MPGWRKPPLERLLAPRGLAHMPPAAQAACRVEKLRGARAGLPERGLMDPLRFGPLTSGPTH